MNKLKYYPVTLISISMTTRKGSFKQYILVIFIFLELPQNVNFSMVFLRSSCPPTSALSSTSPFLLIPPYTLSSNCTEFYSFLRSCHAFSSFCPSKHSTYNFWTSFPVVLFLVSFYLSSALNLNTISLENLPWISN